MRYFPAFLDLQGKPCVVVGGGRVAERKVLSLLKAGASVEVISPKLTRSLSRLKRGRKIIHRPHLFRRRDLRQAFLSIAATDDRGTNERVFQEASKQRIPVNVVDDPAHSSFIVPAVVEKGNLLLAISTSGQSPALARLLRQRLQKEFGPEYAFLLRLLGALRPKILSWGFGQKRNQKIFRQLVREDFLSLIRKKDDRAVRARLGSILGSDFSLKGLGLRR